MISLILILFVALIIPGIIARIRALLSGRRGVTMYQHINSVGVLLNKGVVYSPLSGLVFRAAPIVYLASMLTAILCVPVGGYEPLFSFKGDIVLFCYLFALSRIALILAAMDSGSSFQGMGASREALYGALLEPALFLVFGTLALASGQLSFATIFLNIGNTPEIVVSMALVMYCLFKIALVEGGRIPVDDPKTHLELTMIHEAMVLDYCGFDLALITVGGWIKVGVLAVLASSAMASVLGNSVLLVLGGCLLIAISIGVTESLIARNKLVKNATYIMMILAVALMVFMVIFISFQNITIM